MPRYGGQATAHHPVLWGGDSLAWGEVISGGGVGSFVTGTQGVVSIDNDEGWVASYR